MSEKPLPPDLEEVCREMDRSTGTPGLARYVLLYAGVPGMMEERRLIEEALGDAECRFKCPPDDESCSINKARAALARKPKESS